MGTDRQITQVVLTVVLRCRFHLLYRHVRSLAKLPALRPSALNQEASKVLYQVRGGYSTYCFGRFRSAVGNPSVQLHSAC